MKFNLKKCGLCLPFLLALFFSIVMPARADDPPAPSIVITGGGPGSMVVGDEKSASFDAVVNNPPATNQECTIGGPKWSWSASVSGGPSNDGAGGSASVEAPPAGTEEDASITLTLSFSKAGTYHVVVSATAAYTSSCAAGGINVSGSTSFDVVAEAGVLSVSSDKATICAGAVASPVHRAVITVTLKDKNGIALAGKTVALSLTNSNEDYPATLGTSSVTTDSSGNATATLTSGQLIDSTATVKAEFGEVTSSTSVKMGSPEASWNINPNELIADGESKADVEVTLTFGSEKVDGHSVTWEIVAVENEDGDPVDPADFAPYGSISPLSGTTDGSGFVTTKYTVGTEAGTITFGIVDNNVFEEEPEEVPVAIHAPLVLPRNAAAQNAPAQNAPAQNAPAQNAPAPNPRIKNKGFTNSTNINPETFYTYAMVNDPKLDVPEIGTFYSGHRVGHRVDNGNEAKYLVGLLAKFKRFGNTPPQTESINFKPVRIKNGQVSGPVNGGRINFGIPSGGYTTWTYKSNSPHWDVTKLQGRWSIGLEIPGKPTPKQVKTNFKIDKRSQIVNLATDWKGTSETVCPEGPLCTNFVNHIYKHLSLAIKDASTFGMVEDILGNAADTQKGSLVFYHGWGDPLAWKHIAINVGSGNVIDQNCNSGLHDDTVDGHSATDPAVVNTSKYGNPVFRSTVELQELDNE